MTDFPFGRNGNFIIFGVAIFKVHNGYLQKSLTFVELIIVLFRFFGSFFFFFFVLIMLL